MNDIILRISDEETRRLMQRAQQSGYASPEAYLRALMEADLAVVSDEDETLPPPISGDALIAAIEAADFSAEDVEEMARAIQQGGRIDHAGW